jgi:two-component system, chemotaxis family, CheB/CheR fusion protein
MRWLWLTGASALAVADRFAPDMVFLDLNMPQMDGYAVARVLRQTWPGPLLLVAHSAQGMQSDIDAAFAAGFDHHLLKPAEATALLALIEQGLAQICRR